MPASIAALKTLSKLKKHEESGTFQCSISSLTIASNVEVRCAILNQVDEISFDETPEETAPILDQYESLPSLNLMNQFILKSLPSQFEDLNDHSSEEIYDSSYSSKDKEYYSSENLDIEILERSEPNIGLLISKNTKKINDK